MEGKRLSVQAFSLYTQENFYVCIVTKYWSIWFGNLCISVRQVYGIFFFVIKGLDYKTEGLKRFI